jgi:two-component system, LuxR family, response regulator FixJ
MDRQHLNDNQGPVRLRRAAKSDTRFSDVKGADRLTPREREVLLLLTSGASNKSAGRLLGISPRTVEVHRARIMSKLGARNAVELVRIVLSPGQGR